MSEFKSRVIKVIKNIPEGKVASYGQIAAMVGIPRAARQVGWILNKSNHTLNLPWWRVINNSGRITIKGSEFSVEDQKTFLLAEKVEVSDRFEVDMTKYRWNPDEKIMKSLGLSDRYIFELIEKYDLPFKSR